MGIQKQHNSLINKILMSPLSRHISVQAGALVVLSIVAISNSAYLYGNQDANSSNPVITLQIMTTLLLSAVSILLAFNLYKRIQKPVAQLHQLASAKLNNHEELTFEHKYQDEFSHIAQAFKHLPQLANNNDEIHYKKPPKDEQNQTLIRQLKLADLTINCHELIFSEKPEIKSLEVIVAQLAKLLRIEDVDLCLMNGNGQAPYAHISAMRNKSLPEECISNTCSKCVTDKSFQAKLPTKNQHKIPLLDNQRNQIGILIINVPMQSTDMQPWQKHCAHSIAAQLSKVLATINLERPHAPSA